mmetsp:Transcript_31622/g.36326  ORF Transcript_31622/g.36326 Transcript_31622/m.36326 type:complete len:322 (-) Transcript_31622:85-1050(-)
MAPALYTTILNTQAIKKLCKDHRPQYTCVQKSEEEDYQVLAIFRVDGQPPLKWICGCGELWPAKGRDFYTHLANCPRAICYEANRVFNGDTNDGSSTKMNAIDFDTYEYLNATPEFGLIKSGSILSGTTVRYHHDYLFACGSCGKRFGGKNMYDSLLAHLKNKKCESEDKTAVTIHHWNDYQVNLNNSYERVPFDMIVDVKMKEREEQQAKSDLEKRIKEERRVVKKAETKVKRNEAAKRRRIEKKAKDALNADEEEEDAEEKEDDDKNADEGEENDDNEAVDEADDEKNQSKSTTRSTRSMSTIKINPNRRSPRNKTKQN